MKLSKSFNQFSKDKTQIVNFFYNNPEYWAHIHPQKEPETLHLHIFKVEKYFLKIIELNKLEPIIDKIIHEISIQDIQLSLFVKEMFYLSIIFHDFGKINPNFQINRLQNKNFHSDEFIKVGNKHSIISVYFFLRYIISQVTTVNFTKEKRLIIYKLAFLFSLPIIKHHSGFICYENIFTEEIINSIHHLTESLNVCITKEQIKKLLDFEMSVAPENLTSQFYQIINKKTYNFFPLFLLLKLNYSLLTASDYLATSDYMNNLVLENEVDFGLMTEDFKKNLFENFDNNKEKEFNIDLLRNTEVYLQKDIAELNTKNKENLNFLRQMMGAKVLTEIQKYKNQRVFYIEAPTGGGKTNLSMVAVRKLLEIHSEINKVIYVFPFTTLITQTFKAIKETFKLKESDIIQVHSKSGFKERNYDDSDAQYGKERRNQIDNLFIHYPFTLMTHIKFFDVLKSNEKDTNYLFHRLANSIVIIDELQAYNPDRWDKIKYFISQFAELLNIRFIIMSATLPKIDEIELSGFKPKNFVNLISNAKQFLQNPNFAERVKINIQLIGSKTSLQDLSKIVFEKSINYAVNRKDTYKGSVFTIIEFIFKKSASDFYEIANNENDFFEQIFLLSGTILEPRRRYIIDFLKDKKNRSKRILLITTQVVEAGVDIDMDLGFKNQSLIDSDEQLAGRINRNVEKENCELYLFKHDNPNQIYGNDLRYIESQKLSINEIYQILQEKAFNELYKNVFANIFKTNNSVYKKGLNDYLSLFKQFDFKAIHQKFKLIESESANIFVPVDISILGYNGKRIFSEREVNYLFNHNCFILENEVSGEKVWVLYKSLIENGELDLSTKMSELKILNSIMSNFVISVYNSKIKELFQFIENTNPDEKDSHQYYKLHKFDLDNLYSIERGFIESYLMEKTGVSFEFI